MKHFKIVDFNAKKVSEFDIKDDETIQWSVINVADEESWLDFESTVNKTTSNFNYFQARKLDMQ